MKVLDLCCAAGHGFEGWFASAEACDEQREQGLLECPVCGSTAVVRRPSAPRLNLSGAQPPAVRPPSGGPGAPSGPEIPAPGQAPGRLRQALDELMRNTQDVGERFVEEARRIHYGEAEERAIRGQTTPNERRALADEGIDVFTLPVTLRDKGSLQ